MLVNIFIKKEKRNGNESLPILCIFIREYIFIYIAVRK